MKLEVFFDYTCPFCYLGYFYLKDLLDDYPDIEIDWKGCEAHPLPEERFKFPITEGPWVEYILPAAEKEEIPISAPKFPVGHSTDALQGVYVVEENDGDIMAYHTNMFEAMYREAKDIEDRDVIAEKATASNLPVRLFEQAWISGAYLDKVKETNKYAYEELKIEAIPSFKYGDKILQADYGIGIDKQKLKSFLDDISQK